MDILGSLLKSKAGNHYRFVVTDPMQEPGMDHTSHQRNSNDSSSHISRQSGHPMRDIDVRTDAQQAKFLL